MGAGVAARGGCEMSMGVWALGPDRDDVYAVAKNQQTNLLLSGVYSGVIYTQLVVTVMGRG